MAQSTPTLRIGTRGSPLALVQARAVAARLAAAAGVADEAIEIVVIRTSGDTIQDRPLSAEGGKGLFTKEIEEALLGGRIDLAVHSAKDMPTVSQPGLALAACLEREDPRDVFISPKARTLAELPQGATLGTASLRRQAVAKRARPDLNIALLRGNVQTRLRKLDEGRGGRDALGARRHEAVGLGAACHAHHEHAGIPAGGRTGRHRHRSARERRARARMVGRINHDDTFTAIACERAFLAALDGSCKTPIAGHAVVSGDAIEFRGLIARPDGAGAHDIDATGRRGDAEKIGAEAGHALKRTAGPNFFD